MEGGEEKMKTKARLIKKMIEADFERWNELYSKGGRDPLYADGANLNLVRNRIIYERMRCEAELQPDEYPKEYFEPIPPTVDNEYMARADEIREHARSTLQVYLSDSDYKYLRENISRLTEEQKKQISIVNVLNYVEGLKDAIENDELVWMRRHEEPDIYLDSFRECRARTEKIFKAGSKIPEGQLSIFDLFEV